MNMYKSSIKIEHHWRTGAKENETMQCEVTSAGTRSVMHQRHFINKESNTKM